MLRYSVVGNTNPELFASVTVGATGGQLTLVYAPFVSGRAEITVRASDPTGRWAEQVVEVWLPEIDAPQILVKKQLRLNRQTGLWEQTVTVTNTARRDIGAVRLLIGGLAPGVSVYNASGRLEDGRAEVVYNRTLPAGDPVEIVIEYYSANRTGYITPEVEVEVSLRRVALTAGRTFAIDRLMRSQDGTVLVEFSSEPGGLYLIQYSSDLRRWQDILVRIRAGGSRVQWIDRDVQRSERGAYYRVMPVVP